MFISSYDTSGYGDSENHDVDITIYDSEESYNNNMDKFYDMIVLFEKLEKINSDNNIFNKYKIKKIYDITLNCDNERRELKRRQDRITEISRYLQDYQPHYTTKVANLEKSIRQKFNGIPHFHIILHNHDNNTYIIIDLLGYPICDTEYNINNDIDVNTLYMTTNGIQSKFDFFTTMESIIQRRGILKINIENMVSDLATKPLNFNEKSRIYNNIVNFIGLRTKILANGYTSIESDTKIIDIYLEKEKICEISDLHPPYIGINFDCGHSLSVMALAGLVNIQNNQYTEFIGCPYCREKLLPKLINNNITQQIIYDTETLTNIIENNQLSEISPTFNEKIIPIRDDIMSNNNINNVLENMGYYNDQYDNQYDNQYDDNYDYLTEDPPLPPLPTLPDLSPLPPLPTLPDLSLLPNNTNNIYYVNLDNV
jgi:hypothetical protein